MSNNDVTCTTGLLTENGSSTLIASESFQESVADIQYISRQSVGNAINDVTNWLIGISKHHITLPVDVTELNKIKKKKQFYEIAHFPNTVGAIDCTDIRLKAPSGTYIRHSKKVSFHEHSRCMRFEFEFLNIVTKWPVVLYKMCIVDKIP